MHKTIIIALFALAVAALSTAALAQTTSSVSVTGITISSSPDANSAYSIGESIVVQVAFTGPVTVVWGTPQLALTVGSVTRQAAYSSGSDTNILTFSYTVQTDDRDTDGVSIAQNSVQGSIFQTGTTFEALLQHRQ